jgi:hypothetical protein
VPAISAPQMIFLAVVVVAFVIFGLTLLVVSLRVSGGEARDAPEKPIEREVIQAQRAKHLS